MTSEIPITLYVAGSTLTDALVAGAALFARRHEGPRGPTLGARRVAMAALATSASYLFKVPFFWALGVGPFGLIHLAYADLVVLLPALGAIVLIVATPIAGGRARLRLSPFARFAATSALVLAPVGVYATWIEPFRLCVETARLEVPARRSGRMPIRIGVMTDIQTDRVTDHERRAVELLMAQQPDLILIPGDLFQGTPAQFRATRSDLHDLLARLAAPGGVYLVLGDVEGRGDHLPEILDGTGIRLLVDEAATVELGDRRLTIGGIELNYLHREPRRLVERLETATGEEDIRILLAHRPDAVLEMRPRSRIDLVVAGHTHGGQVVIPGYGPPITLSRVPRSVAAGGLHRIEGNAIYVGRGVGHERDQAPRIRFLCPPEVAVIEVAG